LIAVTKITLHYTCKRLWSVIVHRPNITAIDQVWPCDKISVIEKVHAIQPVSGPCDIVGSRAKDEKT
jgi:hypothetical protein